MKSTSVPAPLYFTASESLMNVVGVRTALIGITVLLRWSRSANVRVPSSVSFSMGCRKSPVVKDLLCVDVCVSGLSRSVIANVSDTDSHLTGVRRTWTRARLSLVGLMGVYGLWNYSRQKSAGGCVWYR